MTDPAMNAPRQDHPPLTEDEKFRLARQQVAALKGFYIHLTVFVLVMALLFAVNIATLPGWWVEWPLLGWGIGIAGHAFAVFGSRPGKIDRWERGKVLEFKRRLDRTDARAPSPDQTPPPPEQKAS